MPEVLSGMVVLDEALVRSPYMTPWQAFRLQLTQLVQEMQRKAEEHEMEILPSSWRVEGGAFGLGNPGPLPVIRVRGTAVPFRITGPEIDAAMEELRLAGIDLHESARASDFVPVGQPPGPERDAALARLREADALAGFAARRTVRRALTAAREVAAAQLRANVRGIQGGPGLAFIKAEISTPPEVDEVKGIDRDALTKLNGLADFKLELEGRFWGPGEIPWDGRD